MTPPCRLPHRRQQIGRGRDPLQTVLHWGKTALSWCHLWSLLCVHWRLNTNKMSTSMSKGKKCHWDQLSEPLGSYTVPSFSSHSSTSCPSARIRHWVPFSLSSLDSQSWEAQLSGWEYIVSVWPSRKGNTRFCGQFIFTSFILRSTWFSPHWFSVFIDLKPAVYGRLLHVFLSLLVLLLWQLSTLSLNYFGLISVVYLLHTTLVSSVEGLYYLIFVS